MKKMIAIACIATAAVVYGDDAEVRTLRALAASNDPAAKEKAAGLAAAEEENARLDRSKTLDPQQVREVVAAKHAGHERRMAGQASNVPAAKPTLAFRGIVEAEDIPNPFRATELTILNFWGGERAGAPIGVYSGFRPDDPARGVLVVFDRVENTRGTWYDVPGAPAAIANEVNGKLLLHSRAATQTFDLATRTFE